jgi:hypothetical protein
MDQCGGLEPDEGESIAEPETDSGSSGHEAQPFATARSSTFFRLVCNSQGMEESGKEATGRK